MLWKWLLEAVAAVVDWLASLFPSEWVIPFPADGFAILVPVPFGLDPALNSWAGWALAVSAVLIGGRVVHAIYRLIPFNG